MLCNTATLRKLFLDFFSYKRHKIVPSASLLPKSTNLLFTNAGMNTFVPFFLGIQDPPWPRVANTQKCIRASGKHNDLEDVGYDAYHHTFFEMLGNWSFGDYFKKEAITWAWKFLTKICKFPKNRLYSTVYKPNSDEPAKLDKYTYNIWKLIFESEGINPDIHILYGSKKENFWMMGDTGPCGPCTEIHIDLTESGNSNGELVNTGSPYCVEIWNLVFIQFNAEVNGTFKPLQKKYVDTGMGFERIAGIVTTTCNFTDFTSLPNNYNCDLFSAIFTHITKYSGYNYSGTIPKHRDNLSKTELKDTILRILADHIRTMCFAIADSIYPGNVGRNYVLRSILRRAVLFSKQLGLPVGFFSELSYPLIAKMGCVFPELINKKDVIYQVLIHEEDAFNRTLENGLKLLDKIIANSNSKNISGKDAFVLYDTYGLPFHFMEVITRERGFKLDKMGFEMAMNNQKKQSSSYKKKKTIFLTRQHITNPKLIGDYNCIKAIFLGYFEINNVNFIITDKSPFNPKISGEIGTITLGYITVDVFNSIRDNLENHLHKVAKNTALYHSYIGKSVTLTVNKFNRSQIQRYYSAGQLLHYALRKVLGNQLTKVGVLAKVDYLHFNFTNIFTVLSPNILRFVERIVNEQIFKNRYIKTKKKVLYVAMTGELGLFSIVCSDYFTSGIYSIEAICGKSAYRRFSIFYKIAEQFGTYDSYEILKKIKYKQKILEDSIHAFLAEKSEDLINKVVKKNKIKWIASSVNIASAGYLRKLGTRILNKIGEDSIIVLGTVISNKAVIAVFCGYKSIERGYRALDIVRKLAYSLGGSGGGNQEYAMGGGKNTTVLNEVLQSCLLNC